MKPEGFMPKIFLALNGIVFFIIFGLFVFIALNWNYEYAEMSCYLGSLTVFFCIVGMMGVFKESRVILMSYTVAVILIITLFVGCSIHGMSKRGTREDYEKRLLRDLEKGIAGNEVANGRIHNLQILNSCCGARGPSDFGDNVPSTCCKKYKDFKCSGQYTRGCADVLFAKHKMGYIILLISGCICGAVLIVACTFAIILASKYPSDWNQVFIYV